MIKRLSAYMILVIFVHATNAQNIVSNPDFEQFYSCPDNYNTLSQSELIPDWTVPSQGTSDYFNRCDHSKRAGVPQNRMGYMEAKSGNGYAGIILSGEFNNDNKYQNKNYREYLQNTLELPLERGKTYCIKLYFCIASNSMYSVNRLGVYFSRQAVRSSKKLMEFHPQVSADTLRLYREKDVWNLLCATFTAKGNERYMTIGNFYTDANTRYFKFPPSKISPHYQGQKKGNFAYYYIDQVSVEATQMCNTCCPNTIRRILFPGPDTIVPENAYILKNIYFNFDKHSLNPRSFATLDVLVNLLQQHPNWKIEIGGHTDSIGDNAYNYELSLRRAEAVTNYLYRMNIQESRVYFAGYGYSDPLSTNQTQAGRTKNRRVEFRLVDW